MRTKLFISHATQEDNEFAAWLAAKLELHGYDVWVDIKELDTAADFWNTIETEIRDNATKFLFVATQRQFWAIEMELKRSLPLLTVFAKAECPILLCL